MLVIGAKGHAKELLQVLLGGQPEELTFFDNISNDAFLFNDYKILHSLEEVRLLFQTDNRFVLGTGNPPLRHKLCIQFENLGGELCSVISQNANIGNFDVSLGDGLNIMDQVFISNSVHIGKGTLLNHGCKVHHDTIIKEFCELSPASCILGGCVVGSFCVIGAGAILLPKVRIGSNVIVGAGAIVTKDIPDNCIIAGVPAKKIKDLPALELL